jgi:hypothetical protein
MGPFRLVTGPGDPISPGSAWTYPAERDWSACEKCHAAIEVDDREALLDRASLIPVPRTLPDRYAPLHLERARRQHVQFSETRSGPPRSNLPG